LPNKTEKLSYMDLRTPESDVYGDFKCKQCGECCRWQGHVLLTDQDIKRLSELLAVSEADFIDQYTDLASNRAQLTLKDQADGACIFLSGSTCSVYPARPDQCRQFPRRWRVGEGCKAISLNHGETL